MKDCLSGRSQYYAKVATSKGKSKGISDGILSDTHINMHLDSNWEVLSNIQNKLILVVVKHSNEMSNTLLMQLICSKSDTR